MPAKKNTKYRSLKLLGKAVVHYPDAPSPKTLETFRNQYASRGYWIRFECPEFTSMCPVTGQPDFAKITIEYVADTLCIESKSLKFYLASYRNTRSFNEEIVNRILEDLVTACRPRQAIVYGEFAARGGISVSVDARYPDDLSAATDGRQIGQSRQKKESVLRRRSPL
jgi:7-cyano-7-deazaguanine reductase